MTPPTSQITNANRNCYGHTIALRGTSGSSLASPTAGCAASFGAGSRAKARGRGMGKGKRFSGKGVRAFLASLTEEDEDAFFGKGRRKGNRKGKSRGKGRRGNPIGKDGQRMRCWVEKPAPKGGGKRNSTEHLSRDCPFNRSRSSSSTALIGETEHDRHHIEHTDNPSDYGFPMKSI